MNLFIVIFFYFTFHCTVLSTYSQELNPVDPFMRAVNRSFIGFEKGYY